MPVATGDEQGGAYFPEALLQSEAVDVLRVDATCMGGVTGFAGLLQAAREAGVPVSPHIYAPIHAPLLCGLGAVDTPVEFGWKGNGVDPLSESLWEPRLEDGLVRLQSQGAGFGFTLDPAWLERQEVGDPAGIFSAGGDV
jgi:L-alanine-DL-glutamate epimerase-like enolase superfamily enzyme